MNPDRRANFTEIMSLKLEQHGRQTDTLRTAVESSLKGLKAAGIAEAASLEKTVREILSDSGLTSKKRNARLKGILEDALDRLAARSSAANGTAAQGTGVPPLRAAKETGEGAPVIAAAGSGRDPKIFVLDLRKKPAAGVSAGSTGGAEQTAGKDAVQSQSASSSAFSKDGAGFAAGARTASSSELHDASPAQEASSAQAQTALDRLRDMAGVELTRAAGIILRDGGGEIRLVLKPESLGSVRVRLNLADNVIDGKIIVDNAQVKQVLEASMDSLARALTAEGFQTASLQVSVGGDGMGGRQADQQQTPMRRVETAQDFAHSVADAVEPIGWDRLLVNLFA